MKIHVYAKLNESLDIFETAIGCIKSAGDEMFLTCESRRSFSSLDSIKTVDNDLVFVISSLGSIGLNDVEIATQLSWFVDNQVKLVICDISSTYEYGVNQPMNMAILNTILQSILSNNTNVITVSFKRSNSGRSKLPFPDNWDELYELWSQDKISSREFIERSGLKKATFYNLMAEYKDIQKLNEQYVHKYQVV